MGHPNEDVIRNMFAANERGDREALNALLADDVTYRSPGRNPFSGDYRGADAVIDLWDKQKEVTGGRPYHASPYGMVVTDDHVIMLANVTTERDDKPYTFRTANVYRVAEGRVAECWPHVFDLHAFDEFWS